MKITMETLKTMTTAELKNLKEAGDQVIEATHSIDIAFSVARELFNNNTDARLFNGELMTKFFCKLYENDNVEECDKINQWLVSHKF